MSSKPKKIIFSEEIDSRITGYSLVISFIIIAVLLIYIPDYFGNKLISNIVKWTFLTIGSLGLFIELSKQKSDIKGVDDIGVGIFFLLVAGVQYILLNKWFVNILGFLLFIIGSFGLIQGLIRLGYSIILLKKNRKEKSKTNIILTLTQLFAFILVLIQVVNEFIKIVR